MIVSEVQKNQEIHFCSLIKHKYWTKMRDEFTSYCTSLFCESNRLVSDAFIMILIFNGGYMMFVIFFCQDLRW